MRVLVTGATGLIGKKLCRELLLKGHELVVVGRSPENKFRQNFTLPCEYHSWDNLKLTNIQAVFHLAGSSIANGRWTPQKKAEILNSRTNTTQKLVTAFTNEWPNVFIGASAIGYYGNRDNEQLTEKSAQGVGFLPEVCEKWEESANPFEDHSRVVRFRIGVVLDASGGFLEPMEKLFSLGLGGKVSSGEQWMSWIHSKDLIRLLLFALEKPIEGTFNAVSPRPVTNNQWAKTFSKQLNVPAFLPAPSLMLKILLGEMSQLATDSQNVSSEKIASQGFEFHFDNLASALENIYQWKTRPTERLFESEQWISADKENIFPFFSESTNLEKITPSWLKFKVLKQSTNPIRTGTIIDYRISIKGLPVKWQTEIKSWNPPNSFVDDQLKGPYKKWYHSHMFEQFPQGTLMKDRVVYELPLGRLGELFLGSFVRSDVTKIFSFRKKTINKLKSQWEE